MIDLDDDELEIVEVPAWTPEIDDGDDEDDDYAARFAREHASVLGDIEADLDDQVYEVEPAPTPVARPRVRPRGNGLFGRLPRAVRDLGLTA